MKCTNCGYLSKNESKCDLCKTKLGEPKKKKGKTGELELFKEIWNERPHICEVDGKPLGAFSVGLFSHVLTKGAYPGFRLYKKNIVLCRLKWHQQWEIGNRDVPELKFKKELAEALKTEYYNK